MPPYKLIKDQCIKLYLKGNKKEKEKMEEFMKLISNQTIDIDRAANWISFVSFFSSE